MHISIGLATRRSRYAFAAAKATPLRDAYRKRRRREQRLNTAGVARLGTLLTLCLGLASCQAPEKPIPPFQQSGELVVVTRNSPTTYYEDAEGKPAGLEYDLVSLFAKELGVKPRFVVATQFDQIIPTLQKHQAHMAAAGLSITPERQKEVLFGPPYQTVQEEVVYNTSLDKPKSVKDLIGRDIEVVAGSSYAARLTEYKKQYPGLKWHESHALESEELIDKVASGKADIVIADSNIVDIARNYYPNIDVAFDFGPPEQVAWAFPKDTDPVLLQKAQAFFQRITKDGALKKLIDRYYGHVFRLERADVAGILDKMRTTLPRFRLMFQQAQDLTGVDWRLLAALAYQESHWDPFATSPTGVRGVMMLTDDTADRMGVLDRLDPKQSIPAGARYFVAMKDMIPDRIPEPDRTWMALAAYNVGYGHLEDARILAQRMKLNPDSWTDVKKTLPLLSQTKYYTTVKHGYARGGEPVIFVENIRTYYDILAKFEKPYRSIFPGLEAKNGQADQPTLAVVGN